MFDVTVVCVWNKRAVLDSWLLGSLKLQRGVNIDLVLVDNSKSTYSSAASALNFGATGATGDYILFAHQDIYFGHVATLQDYCLTLMKRSEIAVIGPVGATPSPQYRSRMRGSFSSSIDAVVDFIVEPICAEVQSLDEVAFMVRRREFAGLSTDICRDWDLYCVEYCLRMNKVNKICAVLSIPVAHRSNGKVGRGYFEALRRLPVFGPVPSKLFTTCGVWYPYRGILYNKFIHYSRITFSKLWGERGERFHALMFGI